MTVSDTWSELVCYLLTYLLSILERSLSVSPWKVLNAAHDIRKFYLNSTQLS
jgi:hypothetical protein